MINYWFPRLKIHQKHFSLYNTFFPIKNILVIISRRALAQEGDYEMHPVHVCVCALVCHADFSKTATATDFL